MFKVEVRPGFLHVRNNDLHMRVSGAANHTSMINLAEQYLGGEDLEVFRSVCEVFGGCDGFTIEYDDTQKSMQRLRPSEVDK